MKFFVKVELRINATDSTEARNFADAFSRNLFIHEKFEGVFSSSPLDFYAVLYVPVEADNPETALTEATTVTLALTEPYPALEYVKTSSYRVSEL